MPDRKTVATIAIAAIAIVVAGAVAIYVSRDPQGNQTASLSPAGTPVLAAPAEATAPDEPSCERAAEEAERLDPLATGQLAAFRVASRPLSLSSLAFFEPDGTAVTLADFAGRTMLVNLWATWCVPCRVEMPALDALEAEFGGDDFGVLAISLDRGSPDVPRAFLDEIAVRNLDLYVDAGMATLSAIQRVGTRGGLPTTVLVDEAGCLLGVIEGPAEWDSPDATRLITAALEGGQA